MSDENDLLDDMKEVYGSNRSFEDSDDKLNSVMVP